MFYPSYSVAIRTLGTAGEKYMETLRSCERQIVKPEKILVYIPYGYPLPQETIGVEEYVRCEKGMVAQRSLPFKEIDSEFILFLDDDLSFQNDFVKILFEGLIENNGDCICPDIYHSHRDKFLIKVRNFMGGTRAHCKRDWAFVIRKDSHYSYNLCPSRPVLQTESAAGACALCRKSSYESIHFEDERWLDNVKFAFGEDQLFFYKLYRYGYKVLVSYVAPIIHLNAKVSHKDPDRMDYAICFSRYVLWYRTIWETSSCLWEKFLACLALSTSKLIGFPLTLCLCVKSKKNRIKTIRKARNDAKRFVSSSAYLNLPNYMAHYPQRI